MYYKIKNQLRFFFNVFQSVSIWYGASRGSLGIVACGWNFRDHIGNFLDSLCDFMGIATAFPIEIIGVIYRIWLPLHYSNL